MSSRFTLAYSASFQSALKHRLFTTVWGRPGAAGGISGITQDRRCKLRQASRRRRPFELTSISFDLIGSSGGSGDFIVNIFNDNGETFHAPGESFASFDVPFPAALPPSSSNNLIFTAMAPPGIVLQAGQIYWISPWASDDADWALWWTNSGQTGLRAAEEIGTNSWFSACGATNDN